jgi:DNA-binding CsgD family transcriptional regulator
MTKADKAELRGLMRRGDERSNREIAADLGCSEATVRKYRRILAPLTGTRP